MTHKAEEGRLDKGRLRSLEELRANGTVKGNVYNHQ